MLLQRLWKPLKWAGFGLGASGFVDQSEIEAIAFRQRNR